MKKITVWFGAIVVAGMAAIALSAIPASAETVETQTDVTASTTSMAYWWSGHRTPGGISIGPRATKQWLNNNNVGDGAWFGGGQVRWYGGGVATQGGVPWLGIEFSADYRRVNNPVSGKGADQFPLHGDALYYFSPNRISPYIIGGVGWEVAGDSVESRWGPEAGGGIQFWLTDVFSINGDYRHQFMIGTNSNANNVMHDNNNVSIGFNIHFGGAEYQQTSTTTETHHERTIIHETP
jgi:hypothetical protein